ncbi:hypothetical protein AVEN_270875-1 [Araneus ventricosus]|uniref:Uncharacterized protein n=1 Tax=Araneus ventricosus TaxID=182803 RepID=A0A4Y2LZ95_ARAVE|nr:hypothetical protein AVEN_270875-1 [Araneus ventricosus]
MSTVGGPINLPHLSPFPYALRKGHSRGWRGGRVAPKAFFQTSNMPLRRSKSTAMVDPQHKCQIGYRAAEGKSDTFLVPQKQIILTVKRRFRLERRNCRSPSKNTMGSVGLSN